MKRIMSVVLTAAVLASGAATARAYGAPFERGALGCREYRIPALFTLADDSVCASADLRWDHGSDSPQNIDTVFARSPDGYGNWSYQIVNRFDDYADGCGSKNSASFIDSALLQSKDGTLFLLTEAYSSGVGILNTKKGSGCVEYQGKRYVALAKQGESDFRYHIAGFANGFAPILCGGEPTGYSVDEEYRLYRNGEALTMPQRDGSEQPTGNMIAQSVFYADAAFHVFETPYLWLRASRDGGETWSAPQILNQQVTAESDYFLGVCPGRGLAVTVNGRERLIFALYTSNAGRNEKAVTVYSDDGGHTWNRGEEVKNSLFTGKTSESQLVTLPDGRIRMFSRNKSNYVACCDSADGGVTFTKSFACPALCGTKNCMVSFINYSRKLNGKSVIVSSSGGSRSGRADGVVRVIEAGESGAMTVLSEYRVNDGFFAYSCLTELSDGRLALLYEDEPSHINYMVLTMDEAGALSELNGNNVVFSKKETLWQKIRRFLDRVWFALERVFKATADSNAS